MSGLSGLLSPLLTATSNTVGAYEGAQADQAKQRRADALQQILQGRQARESELKDLLTRAQTKNYERQAAVVAQAPRDYVKEHEANRDYDIAHPLPPSAHGASGGEPVVLVGDPENPKSPGIYTPRSQAAGKTAPQRSGGSEPLVLIGDPAKPGEGTYVRRSQAEGAQAPMSSANKPPTEGQTSAAMFANRMESAEKLLKQHEATGAPSAVQVLAGQAPYVGGMARNALSSEAQQLYRQAQEDWVRAKLRKESGAAIGVSEMADEISTYFPQPGDAPSMRAQKAERRHEATRLLKESSGPATKLFEGDHGRGGGPPTGDVDLRGPTPQRRSTDPKPTGTSPLRAQYDAAVAHLKAQGKNDAAILAAIGAAPEDDE